MKDHHAEPFGLMGGVRCAACDETWPCEIALLCEINAALLAELGRALRQWELYADSYEGGAGRDLKEEESAEGDLYRHALAVVAKATGTPVSFSTFSGV